MYRCKFDSSNMKQMRVFLKDSGNCYLDFPKKQIKLLRINKKILVAEVASEVWRRDEQGGLRTGLSLQALHAEDVTQQQNR